MCGALNKEMSQDAPLLFPFTLLRSFVLLQGRKETDTRRYRWPSTYRNPLYGESNDQRGRQKSRLCPKHLEFPLIDESLDLFEGWPSL